MNLRSFCQSDPNAGNARMAGDDIPGDYFWTLEDEDGEVVASGYAETMDAGYAIAARRVPTCYTSGEGDDANGYAFEKKGEQ